MNRRDLIASMGAAAVLLSAGLARAQSTIKEEDMTTPLEAKTADVNGIRLYYEVHGAGAPLVLLHGGIGEIDMFGPVLSLLAGQRQVIAVDLQGHGGTADIDRPLSYEAMADDIGALVKHLGLKRVDVMGYSLGGGVALRLAIQHPERVNRLVVVSTPFRRNGWHTENLEGMAQTTSAAAEYLKQSPLWELYSKKAPRPDDFPRLLDKMAEFLGKDYDWTPEVAGLKHPIQIIAGDWDSVRIDHATEMFKLLGGGAHDALWDGSNMNANRFAVLAGATHYTIFADPRIATIANSFLTV
jgi:pimeloyl-ACP methyl ester carboxylesterase